MQITDQNDSSGKFAIASRKIKAGELILTTCPLVACPVLEKLKTGSVCVGCFCPIILSKNNNNNSRDDSSSSSSQQQQQQTPFSCPHCDSISTFCSKSCYEFHKQRHVASGECNVFEKLGSAGNLGLKGDASTSLLMMSLILARAEAELKILSSTSTSTSTSSSSLLPQDPPVDPASASSQKSTKKKPGLPMPGGGGGGASTSSNPSSLSSSLVPSPTNPSTPTIAMNSPPVAVSAPETEFNFPVVKQQQKTAESKTNENDDDDEDEEEDEDNEDESPSNQQHSYAPKKKSRGGKKNKNNNKNQKKKNTNSSSPRVISDGSTSSVTTSPVSVVSSSSPTTPTIAVSTSSSSLPAKVAADIQVCQKQTRTCLAKEYPELFSSSSDKILQQRNRELQWTSSTTASTPFQQVRVLSCINGTLNKKNPFSSITEESATALKQDAERRTIAMKTAIDQDPPITFAKDFMNLVSNHSTIVNSSSQNHYQSTLETLRRKYNSLFNTNIEKNFFYHQYSVYCCNAFGFYSPADDAQFAQAMYPVASFFNHCCSPNLARRMDIGKGAFFYAVRDIEEGECLTISYTDTHSTRNVMARRLTLLDNYRFWCCCVLCDPSAAHNKRSGEENSSSSSLVSLIVRSCTNCEARGILRPIVSSVTGKTVGVECQCCFGFHEEKHE